MGGDRKTTGAAGEAIAVQTLLDAGLAIVERNWRCPLGELDIVAEEFGTDFAGGVENARWLVLVEVRTRSSTGRGNALAAFPPGKQAKLREVAGFYVQEKEWRGPWRIDAVAVQLNRAGQVLWVEHIRHAVGGG